MSHIKSDTLDVFKSFHQSIDFLLKFYREEDAVTEEQLVELLEIIKETSGKMMEEWREYLDKEKQ